MAVPDLSELQATATEVVYAARRDGRLNTVTPRMVRQTLEARFSLPDGTLNAKEYKNPLKTIIASAATEEMKPTNVAAPVNNTKKRKSEEVLEPQPKKQNAGPQKPKKSSKEFKSSETVASSDFEDVEGQEVEESSETLPSSGSAKENRATSPKELTKPNPKKDSASMAKPSPRASTSKAIVDSDSEMSVLDDEPPKRTKKPKVTKPKDKAADKPKASKGKKPELSKEEETIKRLKSLVLACGVRKVWAKVLKDESPSQQIKTLKQILTDLGMSGRMSLEQAKAIKEKRELAQELEDVQAFAAAATRKKPAKASEEDEDQGDSEEEEEEVLPVKRKTNARRSIMAFLGDQSDDD
ncbi:hypothetical protein DFH07DRAFT_818502 [Mycena maculata]|uniref:DEK C-terminal domain-containing protein n=1 Tax=Mycena maculata TaxID=230809 RepID=A0AAD7NEE0_9AGAR|nr:hypothetical protein DFH07DRAFT_818502 [Mycena maculata]